MFNIKFYSFIFIFLSIFKINSTNVQLDTSFGLKGDGIVCIDVGADGKLNDCVIDSYKRIICVGSATNNSKKSFVVTRSFRNGLIDVTFGNQGFVFTQIGDDAWASSVATYKGKIFVAGTAIISGTSYLVIVCYDSNGKLNTNFGNNGFVIQLINDKTLVNSIEIDNEGNLFIAGQTQASSKDMGFVAKYKNDGNLDVTFGSSGVVVFNIGLSSSIVSTAFAQNYNKILLAGWTASYVGRSFLLIQLNKDGSVDTSFGFNGRVVTSFPDSIINVFKSIVVDCGNNIYLGGYFTDSNNMRRFAIVSYTSAGLLNINFGQNGLRYGSVQFGESEIDSMVLSPESKIIAAMTINKNKVLTSFDQDGNFDLKFGCDGFVVTPLSACADVNTILFQSLTKLVIAGTNDDKFNLIRYKNCVNKSVTREN